jgi:hypothetical protein
MTAPKSKTGAKKATAKPRVRRTQAQIAADKAAAEARMRALADERAASLTLKEEPKFSKTVHFVEDGLTCLEKTWYRGEEVTITEGDELWDLAVDRVGNFIFGKTEAEQIAAYGVVYYREGPWPGLPYDTEHIYEPGQLSDDRSIIPAQGTAAEQAALEKANRQRKLFANTT